MPNVPQTNPKGNMGKREVVPQTGGKKVPFPPGAQKGAQTGRPKGGVAIFGGLGLGAAVKSFTQKIHNQIRGAFWLRSTKTHIPKLEGVNETVLKLAQESSLTPQQVIDNFNQTAQAMDKIANAICQIKVLEAENDGKPINRQMTEAKKQLEALANNLAVSMEAFAGADPVVDAMNEMEENEALEEKLIEENKKYEKNAKKALGIANFDKDVEQANEALEVLNKAIASNEEVSEEVLGRVLESVSKAMDSVKGAQAVADKAPLQLSQAATQKKGRLARLIGKKGKKLTTRTRETAQTKQVQQALEQSKILQAAEKARVAELVAQGADEDEIETQEFAVEFLEKAEQTAEKIEAGPKPEFTRDQLSVPEQELAELLDATLCIDDDGIEPLVKEEMKGFAARIFRLNQMMKSGTFEYTEENCLEIAHLCIIHLGIYYDMNRAVVELAKNGQSAHVENQLQLGARPFYYKAFDSFELLTLDKKGDRGNIFALVDQKASADDKLAMRVENFWEKAWDLYYEMCEARQMPPQIQKDQVKKYLSDDPVY